MVHGPSYFFAVSTPDRSAKVEEKRCQRDYTNGDDSCLLVRY
jgi:hypothetical protein